MNVEQVLGTPIDFCPKCAGVFLDAGEGKLINLDVDFFFGFAARPSGPSARRCPDHGEAMTLFVADTPNGPLTVDRAGCCGGVFLDAGEANMMASVGPARLEAETNGKVCPACDRRLTREVLHDFEVDACSGCGHIFFDPGEAERSDIDTRALFGAGEWAATRVGEAGPCPGCREPMARYEAALFEGSVGVFYSIECGGVWVQRDALPRLRHASRLAVNRRADHQFATGQQVEPSAAQRTPEALRASEDGLRQHQMALQQHVVLKSIAALRRRRRRGHYLG